MGVSSQCVSASKLCHLESLLGGELCKEVHARDSWGYVIHIRVYVY